MAEYGNEQSDKAPDRKDLDDALKQDTRGELAELADLVKKVSAREGEEKVDTPEEIKTPGELLKKEIREARDEISNRDMKNPATVVSLIKALNQLTAQDEDPVALRAQWLESLGVTEEMLKLDETEIAASLQGIVDGYFADLPDIRTALGSELDNVKSGIVKRLQSEAMLSDGETPLLVDLKSAQKILEEEAVKLEKTAENQAKKLDWSTKLGLFARSAQIKAQADQRLILAFKQYEALHEQVRITNDGQLSVEQQTTLIAKTNDLSQKVVKSQDEFQKAAEEAEKNPQSGNPFEAFIQMIAKLLKEFGIDTGNKTPETQIAETPVEKPAEITEEPETDPLIAQLSAKVTKWKIKISDTLGLNNPKQDQAEKILSELPVETRKSLAEFTENPALQPLMSLGLDLQTLVETNDFAELQELPLKFETQVDGNIKCLVPMGKTPEGALVYSQAFSLPDEEESFVTQMQQSRAYQNASKYVSEAFEQSKQYLSGFFDTPKEGGNTSDS